MQRTRQDIWQEALLTAEMGSTNFGFLNLEISLDIRDLLSKLVEKRQRPLVTTEVPLNPREQAILDGLTNTDDHE